MADVFENLDLDTNVDITQNGESIFDSIGSSSGIAPYELLERRTASRRNRGIYQRLANVRANNAADVSGFEYKIIVRGNVGDVSLGTKIIKISGERLLNIPEFGLSDGVFVGDSTITRTYNRGGTYVTGSVNVRLDPTDNTNLNRTYNIVFLRGSGRLGFFHSGNGYGADVTILRRAYANG